MPVLYVSCGTYIVIPVTATMTPNADLSLIARPDKIHPRPTMVQVLIWPTTVLETGPVCATM